MLASLALVLGACSSTTDSADGTQGSTTASGSAGSSSIDALIEEGLAADIDDVQRQILSTAQKTGEVSEADWKEANNRYVQCMSERGHSYQVSYQGTEVVFTRESASGGNGQEDVAEKNDALECGTLTNTYVNGLYQYLYGSDPVQNSQDMERAVLACLIDKGLVPDSTTFDEFSADLSQGGTQFMGEGDPRQAEFEECWVSEFGAMPHYSQGEDEVQTASTGQ